MHKCRSLRENATYTRTMLEAPRFDFFFFFAVITSATFSAPMEHLHDSSLSLSSSFLLLFSKNNDNNNNGQNDRLTHTAHHEWQ